MPTIDETIHLPSELTLVAAEPLWRQLRDALGNRKAIVLDGAAVERISTACLQILVAARRTARERGLGFDLRAPSESFAAAIDSLGLTQSLLAPEA